MISAVSGQPFAATFQTDLPGLGTVGYKLRDGAVEVLARTAVGVTETDPGIYEASPVAPALPAGVDRYTYQIVWDTGGVEPLFATEDVEVRSEPAVAYESSPGITPTVAELGLFVKTRTKTRYGATIGTFNDTTPITTSDAQDLIQQAVDELTLAIGSNLPDGPENDPDLYRRGAKAAVLLLAAMNIELSLSGEQVNDPRSPYAALERRFNSLKKTLVEAVSEARGAYGGGGESDAADNLVETMRPAYNFPPPSGIGTRRW